MWNFLLGHCFHKNPIFLGFFPKTTCREADYAGIFSHQRRADRRIDRHRPPGSDLERFATMATRKKTAKKTAKKAAKKTTARKTTKKPAPKKAAASSVKRIPGSATVRTKSQITNSIVDATGMTRKEVNSVLRPRSPYRRRPQKGHRRQVHGHEAHREEKACHQGRKGINPFTGEEMMFKANAASKAVKVRALKTLNDKI